MMYRQFILGFSLFSVALFSLLLLLTFITEPQLEQQALGFAQKELHRYINNNIEVATGLNKEDPNFLQQFLLKQYRKDIEEFSHSAKVFTDAITQCLANPELKPEQQHQVIEHLTAEFIKLKTSELPLLLKLSKQLAEQTQLYYQQTWEKLLQDIRLFSSVNIACFLILIIASYFNSYNSVSLNICNALLFISTLISSSFYIFFQNWFHTIIYHDFYGTSYIWLLTGIFTYLLMHEILRYIKTSN